MKIRRTQTSMVVVDHRAMVAHDRGGFGPRFGCFLDFFFFGIFFLDIFGHFWHASLVVKLMESHTKMKELEVLSSVR